MAATVLGLLAPVASAADNGSWAVQPTSQPGSTPRQYFVYDLAAGTTVRDSVTIVNETAVPQTFQVYAADGFTTSRDGGLGFASATDPQDAVGAWTKVSRPRVTVAPHRSLDVPFTMAVPAGTAPGDHVGAVVALNTRIEQGPAGSVNIGVQKAVAARVYARVQGPVSPGLEVTGIAVDRSTNPVTVMYTLRNTGNVRLTPTTSLTVAGMLGGSLQTVPPRARGLLLPGEQSQYTEPLEDLPTLDYVTVTVTASTDEVSAVGDTHLWLVPWWLLLVVAVGLAAIIAAVVARKRRRSPAPASAPDIEKVAL